MHDALVVRRGATGPTAVVRALGYARDTRRIAVLGARHGRGGGGCRGRRSAAAAAATHTTAGATSIAAARHAFVVTRVAVEAAAIVTALSDASRFGVIAVLGACGIARWADAGRTTEQPAR